jgi:elongation factor P
MMVLVSDVKLHSVVEIDGKLYRVLEIVRHAGSGQFQGFLELKLQDMQTKHVVEKRFKPTDKLNEVELSKKQMQYLYNDGEMFYFMDPETFEQVGIPKAAIGTIEKFLKENTLLTVELMGEEPISVQFPKIVELKVTMTGPGIREGQDNTMKPATLENGIEILVPQFVETGDVVRVDTEKVKYVERVTVKRV